jgi:hypothetical protein
MREGLSSLAPMVLGALAIFASLAGYLVAEGNRVCMIDGPVASSCSSPAPNPIFFAAGGVVGVALVTLGILLRRNSHPAGKG